MGSEMCIRDRAIFMHRHAGPDENDCPDYGEREKINLQEMDRVDLATALIRWMTVHTADETPGIPAVFRKVILRPI